MGEGQYRADDSVQRDLDRLDDDAVAALERGDEPALDWALDEMWTLIQSKGTELPDDELTASDVIIPPSDLTLEETRELFSDHGLVPDLPS